MANAKKEVTSVPLPDIKEVICAYNKFGEEGRPNLAKYYELSWFNEGLILAVSRRSGRKFLMPVSAAVHIEIA